MRSKIHRGTWPISSTMMRSYARTTAWTAVLLPLPAGPSTAAGVRFCLRGEASSHTPHASSLSSSGHRCCRASSTFHSSVAYARPCSGANCATPMSAEELPRLESVAAVLTSSPLRYASANSMRARRSARTLSMYTPVRASASMCSAIFPPEVGSMQTGGVPCSADCREEPEIVDILQQQRVSAVAQDTGADFGQEACLGALSPACLWVFCILLELLPGRMGGSLSGATCIRCSHVRFRHRRPPVQLRPQSALQSQCLQEGDRQPFDGRSGINVASLHLASTCLQESMMKAPEFGICALVRV